MIVSDNNLRFANNPIGQSYNEEAMAVKYRLKHSGETVKFLLYRLRTELHSENIPMSIIISEIISTTH